MNRAAGIALILLFLLFPVPLSGEESTVSLEEVCSQLKDAGYSLEGDSQILSILEEAEERAIPLTMLTPRIYEGAAKRVPLPKIAGVLQREIQLLDRARSLLRSVSDSERFIEHRPLWQRTALLLRKELSEEDIRRIVRTTFPSPKEQYRPASALFISLTSWGLTKEQAHHVIEALAGSSIPPEQYTGITKLYNRARSQRLSPKRLTDRIVEAAPSADSLRELERRTVME